MLQFFVLKMSDKDGDNGRKKPKSNIKIVYHRCSMCGTRRKEEDIVDATPAYRKDIRVCKDCSKKLFENKLSAFRSQNALKIRHDYHIVI